jgi:hypothetical protein
VAAVAAAQLAGAAGEVPFNTPLQLVRPTRNHTSMVPMTENLQAIAQHRGSISVVAVVGPYHSGKSFLLNALVEQAKVFSIGRKTSPETMGIWLCRTSMKASDGSEVWLLDSEGFFGPGVSESYDAKVFTIASLIGAHLVYNTVKIIDQQAVNLLEMLARRAQLFRTKSSAEQSNVGVQTPEFLSVRNFPPLTWVVEDFIQELPDKYQHVDGATAWLKSYLSKINATGDEDDRFLTRLYSELKVHTLFLPATSREELQDLSRLKWDQLTPEFRDEMGVLRKHILHRLTARTFEGSPMTGQTLDRTIRFIVQALQRGMFHELPSLWATWTQQVAELSMQDAGEWFSALMDSIDAEAEPVRLSLFNSQVAEAWDKAERFYGDLLQDFFVQPDKSELHRRTFPRFEAKRGAYHRRVEAWTMDKVQAAKDSLVALLNSREMPENPDNLEKRSQVEIEASTERFALAMAEFSELGRPPRSPFLAVQMPRSVGGLQDALAKDLRHIKSLRELNNTKKIDQEFKVAVDAASRAVQQEIAANSNKLLGNAKLQELRSLAADSCWRAFDGSLEPRHWMRGIAQYKTYKAKVQADQLERRIQKFVADNDARLKEHFDRSVQRCTDQYRQQKDILAMPVDEETLDKSHKALGDKLRDVLNADAGGLSDTKHFAGAMRNLEQELEEGLMHARQKNVKRWKVDADDATRCAIRENRAVMAKCGLFCLFNKMPMKHRLTSQRHLLDCLKRSSINMPMKLQHQVFENWYAQDLGAEAAGVTFNFKMGMGAIMLLVLCCLARCNNWGWGKPSPQPMYGGYCMGGVPPVSGYYQQQYPQGAYQGGLFR